MAVTTISSNDPSKTVFSNSGAAADLSSTGETEDSANLSDIKFDVLAASGGGAKTTLWSVDDGIAGNNLLANPLVPLNKGMTGYDTDLLYKDAVGPSAYETTAAGGRFWIGADNLLHYDATHISQSINDLAVGAAFTDTFEYTIRMSNGTLSVGTITVKIVNAEDAVVITSTAQTGSVTEDADNSAHENNEVHTQSGAITYTDADGLDIHTAGYVASASNTTSYGSFSLDTTNIDTGHGGTVGWTFNVDDSAIDALQAGQQVVQKYDVTVDDGHTGGAKTETVTITITGAEDAVVITTGAQSGGVSEDADLSANENNEAHGQNGSISYTDADTLDTHSASFAANASNTTNYGTFTLDQSAIDTGNGGTVGWTFQVEDSAIDSLQAGQQVVQKYDVTIDDGHGGPKTEIVSVTLSGAEDAVVITSGPQSGSVTEDADGSAGETSNELHAQAGSILYTDADTLDTHSASFVANAGNSTNYGTFSLDQSGIDTGNGGTVGWSFQVNDGAIDGLLAGQQVVQKYDVTIDDGHGGSKIETVTITINGAADASGGPTIATPVDPSTTGDPNDFDNLGLGGHQTINASDGGGNTYYGGSGADTLNGGQGQDTLFGGSGNDTLNGNKDLDHIYGGSGSDTINGGQDNDVIVGGWSVDFINVADNNDTVAYLSVLDTGDQISGFGAGDKLDFSTIDADPSSANDTFTINPGTAVVAHGINYFFDGANTKVWADTDGNVGTVELEVTLVGVDATSTLGTAGTIVP